MALNGGALNSYVLNGTAGALASLGGDGPVVSFVQLVHALGVSSSDIAQNVGSLGAASTYDIQQEVLLNSTGSGVVVSFKQLVNSLGTPTIDIEQVVEESAATAGFYARNGYEPRLYIGGNRIDNDKIHGKIQISFSENGAPQLTFSLIPDTGVQDLRAYRGKAAKLNIRTSAGIFPIFSGKINIPEIDIVGQKINFSCAQDIEQYVNNTMSSAAVSAVGYYTNAVFSKAQTKWQELQDRLSTVPKVIDMQGDGTHRIDNIAAAGTATYTLTDSSVFRRDVEYEFSTSQNFINKVNITANYNFQRLHHHERSFGTISPHNTVCDFLTGGYDPLTRQLVYSAVTGAPWPVKGDITFSDIYPGGYYKCGDATVGWSTGSITGVTSATGSTTDGNTQYQTTGVTSVDYSSLYCKTASWTASTHFTQNITHTYTLTLNATQSQSDYGVKERDDVFSLTADFNAGDWETYNVHSTSVPSGLSQTGSSGNNFWVDAKTNSADFSTSINTLINRAKAEILRSHRQDKVMFKRTLWPQLSLSDTVELSTGRIDAKGKVGSYTHTIDVNTGEAYTDVTLMLSRASGSVSDSTLSLPAAPSLTPSYPTSVIQMSGGYGYDPEGYSKYGQLTGHIANKNTTVSSGGTVDYRKTAYPVLFRYDVPEISGALRDNASATTSTSYNVSIPNDTLEITFTDTNYQT